MKYIAIFLLCGCTYDVRIDRAVGDLDVTLAPCADAGGDAKRD